MSHWKRCCWLAAAMMVPNLLAVRGQTAAVSTPVANGGFELDADGDQVPDGWQTSGQPEIRQSLTIDAGRDGGRAARLVCTHFEGGSPASHVMICQVGTVSIRRGPWYRISFWTKAEAIRKRIVQVAVSNTRPWESSGVGGQFAPTTGWRKVELLSRATADVPAETSRLQFWFAGTGTLWLDDVQLQPVDVKEEVHPQIDTQLATSNYVPNSSFECGGGGWGSYSPAISTWAGNLNQRIGTIDSTTASHGHWSLKITLDKRAPLVFHWDYYDAIVQPIDNLVTGHFGWIPVARGRPYVFSCDLKANAPDVPVQMFVQQHGSRRLTRIVQAGPQWQRHTWQVTPRADYVWLGVGPALDGAPLEQATLWVDGLQWHPGEQPLPYEPRAAVESQLETAAVGNVFTDPAAGLTFTVRFFNGSDQPRSVSGTLKITDFFGREVLVRELTCEVAAQRGGQVQATGLLPGRLGFFRATWQPNDPGAPFLQTLRCAQIKPYGDTDSPFGMNHAYPWDFMLEKCRHVGLTWMRDWSAKWHTVEPERGRWDFTQVDPQIDRVLTSRLNPLILLPFPSAPWCSGGDLNVIRKDVGDNRYLLDRAVVACPANDPQLFRTYVDRTVRRYRDRVQWFEVMNEPIYTTYAVPAKYGYGLLDYLAILQNAHQSIKTVDPQLHVIGGIGTWVDSRWVQDFIQADGLRWCDVMDVHLYPVAVDPEVYEPDLATTWQAMQARDQARPIWLTEFGCYADDDPAETPAQIGDSAMSRSNWSDEQAASEGLVKSAAVFLTHGIRKIFFHAGTCGPLNGRNGGGIFFEYGGAPRKMYPAVSGLANLLGPNPQPLTAFGSRTPLRSYLFAVENGTVAITWMAGDGHLDLQLPAGIEARDIMGNPLDRDQITVAGSPVYFVCREPDTLRKWLDSISPQE